MADSLLISTESDIYLNVTDESKLIHALYNGKLVLFSHCLGVEMK